MGKLFFINLITWDLLLQILKFAVGILFFTKFFHKCFRASNFDAYLFGPNTRILFLFK